MLARLLFGTIDFPENEELLEFQYKLLMVLMASGALFTFAFIAADGVNLNAMDNPHLKSMWVFTGVAVMLTFFLRGHKERFVPIAWTYEAVCLLEYASAVANVHSDELRLLWLFVNVPGVFIILGQRVGLAITALTTLALIVANPHLPAPYSGNALATWTLSMTYMGLFFHAYGKRFISYFERMRDSNQRLRDLASHDPLTGLLNARAYYSLCDSLQAQSRRSGTPYSILFVDLDHFKAINDNHGHDAGDIVLQTVAQALQQVVRNSDAVGRIGGEEFSLLLTNTDKDGALTVAEALRQSIETLMPPIHGTPLRVTASIGVAASSGTQTRTIAELQHQADQAMYQAKKQGRNRVTYLDDE